MKLIIYGWACLFYGFWLYPALFPPIIDTSPVIHVQKQVVDNSISGISSYYDYDLNRADQKCRSNDCYSITNSTCASRDFKRGTMLKVTNLDNGKEVVCRVNDYGPELSTGRVLDLSSYAFSQISSLRLGLANVKISALE